MYLSAGVNCAGDQTTDDPHRITSRICMWLDDFGVGRDDHDVGSDDNDLNNYVNNFNIDDYHDDACANSNIG